MGELTPDKRGMPEFLRWMIRERATLIVKPDAAYRAFKVVLKATVGEMKGRSVSFVTEADMIHENPLTTAYHLWQEMVAAGMTS